MWRWGFGGGRPDEEELDVKRENGVLGDGMVRKKHPRSSGLSSTSISNTFGIWSYGFTALDGLLTSR